MNEYGCEYEMNRRRVAHRIHSDEHQTHLLCLCHYFICELYLYGHISQLITSILIIEVRLDDGIGMVDKAGSMRVG